MKLKKISRARPNEAAKLQKVSPPNLVPTRLKKSRGLLVWSSVRWFGTKFAGPARTRFARFGTRFATMFTDRFAAFFARFAARFA